MASSKYKYLIGERVKLPGHLAVPATRESVRSFALESSAKRSECTIKAVGLSRIFDIPAEAIALSAQKG